MQVLLMNLNNFISLPVSHRDITGPSVGTEWLWSSEKQSKARNQYKGDELGWETEEGE